jgi:hypothetical protein
MHLYESMNLRETLQVVRATRVYPVSRLRIGSPCKFIRKLDLLVHIVVPELIENIMPRCARYLRKTSPRWGRSWRGW